MFDDYRTWGHTITGLKVHLVWCTKYRYKVLKWDIKARCRDIIRQICNSLDINILKWVVSDDHIHLFIEYPPKQSVSDIVKRLKWRTSNYIQAEFPELKKRYWWQHLRAIWYFAASSWNITDEMISLYLDHHKTWYQDLVANNTFILEWK